MHLDRGGVVVLATLDREGHVAVLSEPAEQRAVDALLQPENQGQRQGARQAQVPLGVRAQGEGRPGGRGRVQVEQHHPRVGLRAVLQLLLDLVEQFDQLGLLGGRGLGAPGGVDGVGVEGAVEVPFDEALADRQGLQVARQEKRAAAQAQLVLGEVCRHALGGQDPRRLVAVHAAGDHQQRSRAVAQAGEDAFAVLDARAFGGPLPHGSDQRSSSWASSSSRATSM